MVFIDTHPEWKDVFQLYMSGFDGGRVSWLDFYPVEKNLGTDARQYKDTIMFVDVGGGFGQEAVALKKCHPKLPGRFVVQDLFYAVGGLKLESIEAMVHDFFQPQPIKGQ